MRPLRQRRHWHHNTQQHVLLEFTNLRANCPEGIYMSLTPGKPTQWSGVLFVRKGPYAPAILRFHVSFPVGYPDLPPLITFTTDIFHPLVTPVTTYTGASTPDSGTQSAPDEQRLPPGGFGLTDAFPHWFGGSERGSASTAISATTPVAQAEPSEHEQMPRTTAEILSPAEHMPTRVSIAHVLGYIKRSFDDDGVLNRLPATAAVNSGAWKAWQAYRSSMEEPSNGQPNVIEDRRKPHSSNGRAIHPDDWSWDGVWERRVRKAIDASISDQVLFGVGGGVDETIQFVPTQNTRDATT